MNEELSSRLRRQEFQRMMARKLGIADNTIDPDKNRIADSRIRHRDELGTKKTDSDSKK